MTPRSVAAAFSLLMVAAASATLVISPAAQADAVAYLVNVTVRPGYHFTGPDDALAAGQSICASVHSGRAYADVMTDVKTEFNNPDEYQASYLIAQAANELCPGLIWQLRNSAAHYQPPGP